jgi:hypothetical protein
MQSRFADWLVQAFDQQQGSGRTAGHEITQKDVRAFSPIDFDLLANAG